MKRTKHTALAFLLALCVTLGLLPALTPAASAATLTNTSTRWSEDSTINTDVTINSGVTVRKNITLTIPEGMTLTVNGKIDAYGYTLTVEGKGTLSVTADTNTSSGNGHCGVEGNLTVNGTTVNVTGGSGASNGDGGIGVDGVVIVTNGSVTITGGAGVNGARGVNSITVNGGSATITGGAGNESGDDSYAVHGSIVYRDGGSAQESNNNSTWTAITSGSDSDARYVKVTAPTLTIPITGITLAPASLTLTLGGSTGTLTATVAPSNATDKTVTWASSNTAVATVDSSGKVTPVAAGTATITATATNGTSATTDDKSATCSVTVNKADISPTVTMSGWTYGGTASSPSVSGNKGNGTVTYHYKASGAAESTYTTTKPSNAGTYTVRATIAETTTYKSGTATANFTIAPKTVSAPTVTVSPGSYVYTGSAQEPGTNVTVKDGNTVIPASEYTLSYSNNTNVGTATVTVTDKSGGNYTVSGSAEFTITSATMKDYVTATMQDLPYTGSIVNAQYTLTYGNLTLVEGTDFDASSATNGVDVGQYTIRFDGKGNYSGTIYARWNITLAPVTVTADNLSKVYGDDDPTLTATVAGLAEGDTLSYTLSRAAGENADEYEITVAGAATQGNYNITYVSGTFTIHKAEATVTPNKVNKFYGDEDPALSAAVTVAGRANGKTSLLDGEEIHYTLSRAEGENVGKYNITAADDTSQNNDAIKANYNVTYATGEFQITKRPLSEAFVSLDHVSFRNDGTSHAPKPVFTTYDVKTSDYTLTGDTSQSDNGVYTLTVKATTNGNFGGSVSFTWFITDVGDNSVTYDGQPHGLSAGEGAIVEYKHGEQYTNEVVTHTDAGTYSIDYRTKVVNPFYDAQDPEGEAQYIDVDGTATLTIAKRPVTITANPQTVGLKGAIPTDADKVTASGVQGVAASGLAEGHSVSGVTLTAPDGTANATDSGTIVPSAAKIQDGGGNDVTENYTITYVNGVLTVTKATPSVTAPTANTLTYNGSAQSLVTAGTTDGGELQYALGDGDTAPADGYTTTIPTGTNAGTYGVWYRVVGNSNYNDVDPAKVSVTIGKAAITPTVSIEGWTHGESAKTPSLGEGSNPGDGTVTYEYKAKGAADSAYSDAVPTAAGEYTVKATVAETDNYQSGTATADFAITKAAISPAVSITGWTYGGYDTTVNAPSVTDNPGNGAVTYSYKLKTAEDEAYNSGIPVNAGTYKVRAVIAETDNYAGKTVEAEFTIAKAPLTITANDNAITYGDAPQANGVTYGVTDGSGSVQNGFVNNETEAVLGGSLSYTFNYNQYDNVGSSYEITPAGLTSDNYEITFVKGTLTVNAKEISLTWGETSFTYNGIEQAPTVTVTGLVGNDSTENVVSVTGGQTNANAKTSTTNYTATATLNNTNYVLSSDSATTAEFTIAQKKLAKSNLTLTNESLAYTGAEIGSEYSVKDTINGQETVLMEDADFQVTGGKTAEGIGSYYIAFKGIGNYAGNFRSAWSITAPTVTVRAEAKSKVYGDADPELTVTFEGLASGDTGDGLTYTVSRASGEDVGQYAITVTVENASQGNYQVQAVNDTDNPVYLSITKATATVTADAKTKVYGDEDPELTATVTGLKNGDTADVIPSYSLSRAEGENVGSYTITAAASGDAQADNYTVVYQPGVLNITKRPLSADFVSLDHSSFQNDGNEHAPKPVFKTYTATESDYTLSGAFKSSENGLHTLTVSATSGGNFSGSVSLNWYITDAGDETVVYDGQPHGISVAEGASVKYKHGDEYTDEEITYTDAGTYPIAYRTEVANPLYGFFDTEPATISVEGTATLTITKRPVTITAENQTVDLNGAIATSADKVTASGVESVAASGLLDGHSITAITLTASDTENVTTSGTITPSKATIKSGDTDVTANYEITYANGVLTVNKVAPDFTAPTAKTGLAYTGDEQELVNAGSTEDGTMEYVLGDDATTAPTGGYATAIPKGANAGTYYVWYKVTGDSNHSDIAAACVTVTIGKADSSVTAPTANTLTYNGTAQSLVAAGTATGGTLEYALGNDATSAPVSGYATAIPTGKGAGTYYVWYKVTGDNNHNDTDAQSVTVTIAQKEAALSWSNTTLTYNGTAQAPSATVSNLETGDECVVTVEGTEINAGMGYTATATALSNANYKLPTASTTTFNTMKKSVMVSGITAEGKTYDGKTDATLNCANVTFVGILDADTGKLTVTATGAFVDADVGENKTVNISSLTLGGGRQRGQLRGKRPSGNDNGEYHPGDAGKCQRVARGDVDVQRRRADAASLRQRHGGE